MNQRRHLLKISMGAIGLLALPQMMEFAKAAEDFIKGPKVKDHPAKQLSNHVWMIYSPDGFPTAENQGMMANITFVITQKGIVVLDTDKTEVYIQPGSLKGSIFRTLRQGQRINFTISELDGMQTISEVKIGQGGY